MRTRRIIEVLAAGMLAGGLLAACGGLDEALEGAVCDTEADCASGQTCVRTLYQERAGALGQCLSAGACTPGDQPGCNCLQDSNSSYYCDGADVTASNSVDPACACVFPCNVSIYGATGCPGNTTASPSLTDSNCVCI